MHFCQRYQRWIYYSTKIRLRFIRSCDDDEANLDWRSDLTPEYRKMRSMTYESLRSQIMSTYEVRFFFF